MVVYIELIDEDIISELRSELNSSRIFPKWGSQ
jgi:hypothetical protein